MSNVTAKECETHRDSLYDDIGTVRDCGAKKASNASVRWLFGIIAVIMIACVTAGVKGYAAHNREIGGNTETIRSQKEKDAIGRAHREAARIEQRAWQKAAMDKLDKLDEKLDAAVEKFLTHDHE